MMLTFMMAKPATAMAQPSKLMAKPDSEARDQNKELRRGLYLRRAQGVRRRPCADK